MKSFVLVNVPRSGLCNRFIVYSQGVVFAYINNLEIYDCGWFKFNLGPIIRNEKSYRLYFLYIKMKINFKVLLNPFYKQIKNPKIEILKELLKSHVYKFDKFPEHANFFKDLIGYNDIIRESILKRISKKVLSELKAMEMPIIGIHIRRGDFRKINPLSEELRNGDNLQIEDEYFMNIIYKINLISGYKYQIAIFTDAQDEEISNFKKIKNVTIFSSGNDVLDFIALSNCRLIVTSLSSTFSLFALFISKGIGIIHDFDKNYLAIKSNDQIFLNSELDTRFHSYFISQFENNELDF